MKSKTILIKLTLITLFTVQSLFSQVEYSIKKINKNVYVFTEIWDDSNNGNLGVIIGDDAVLLINSMMRSSAPFLEKEIQKITDKPIKYVINSDSDPFNHHANSYFSDKGATIISHENLQYSNAYCMVLFQENISISLGDEIITAYHTPAHTLDHLDVYLENSNVIFMSDGFKNHWLTPIGPNGFEGFLSGLDKAIAFADESTIIVSGNTSKNPEKFVNSKEDLLRIRKIHVNFTNRVKELNKKGFSPESIVKDEEIIRITKVLEAYPEFKKYLIDLVLEIIENEFANSQHLKFPDLSKYAGIYKTNNYRETEIVFEKGKLYAREKGAFLVELIPISKIKFQIKTARENFLSFQISKKGKVISFSPELIKNGWWERIIKSEKRTKK
ncbi:MBL fold metallo-hydrolase [Aureivirga marina]|uniref:hypothetical protein n=1 Tax=Aureivirga marina TaxID=1182451 RepID=UPI0018CAE74F|nr:hypothetical protein [Aureivirga marina]